MKYVLSLAPLALLIGCNGDAEPAGEAPDAALAANETEEVVDDAEAQARRESMIASWAANFDLTEEQASCLVENVAWDDLIAAEQPAETVEQITACNADPAVFAGYGR